MKKRIIIIILILVAFSGCVSNAEQTQTDDIPEVQPTPKHTENIFDYTTFECTRYNQIGEYNFAPAGKSYAVVDIHINNQGTQTYTTNPWNWQLKVNGVTYNHDTSTYDKSVNMMNVQVGPGGSIDTQIVFLVDGEPVDFELIYNGL